MKRRIVFILFLLASSFFVGQYAFSANSDIVINEIGAYEPSGHEWIEIWNKGSEPVDLLSWKFWENNTNHSLSVSTTNSILDAGEYGVIVQDATQFIIDYPFFAGSVFDSSWSSLNESGEVIGLKDAQGNFVEQFTYPIAANFSLQRKDSFLSDYTSVNWAEHLASNTVGFVNNFTSFVSTTSITTTVLAQEEVVTSTSSFINPYGSSASQSGLVAVTPADLTALSLNEIVSDPEDGNEWVELFNSSGLSVDIGGAMVCDSRNTTSTCKKITGAVGPYGWLQIDLQSKSFLNNSGDSVILKDVRGVVIDRIDYNDELSPDEGQSLARIVDGLDTDNEADWLVTNKISPGAANVIVVEETVSSDSSFSQKVVSSTVKTIKKTPAIFVWNIIAPSSADINETITLNAEDVADPRGGQLHFFWTLENGQQVVGPEIKTSFATSGTHTVSLFVTSTSGYGENKKIEISVGSGLAQNADIIISEILPNPEGDDSAEFIELKNNSATVVNLAGWFLKVGDKKYTFVDNTIIAPNGTLVFYKAATKISLVNTVGKVELFNKDKTLVDLVKYEKPLSGKSFALVRGEWRWVKPNPGKILTLESESLLAEEKNSNTNQKTATKSVGALVINIGDVRSAVKGQPVKIKGIVSVVPNIFGSQFFYINNDNAGVQIYQSKKDFPPLGVGDLVEVSGTVSEVSGIKRVNIKNSQSVDILSLGNVVPKTEVSLSGLEDSNAGALVQVEGEITELKSSFMFVDNGEAEIKVTFKKNAQINKQNLKEGERVWVVGILEKTASEWQLWPRSNDDVQVIDVAPDAKVLGEKISNTKENVVKKYSLVTLGGISALVLAFLIRFKGVIIAGWVKQAKEKFFKRR
ncbi:MAG: lamin tail domain-containing protein [Candidatus Magasanikbacteria bacterium]|nr:lamin tail domain-containing protein [Candidatus Magasanikbacteria bacterium]